jgi:DNA-binding XRE family transcriptional regulator
MMIDDITFARQAVQSGRARKIREDAGVTRETVAHELGVAISTIYKWDTTKPRLTDANAARYGALLRRLQGHTTRTDTESQPA